MNESRHFPPKQTEELDAFERQLRSLTPRAAAFRLAEASAPDATAHTPSSESSSMAAATLPATSGNRSWTAKLIAAWSLGAAAGIGGTLLCLYFTEDNREISGLGRTRASVSSEVVTAVSSGDSSNRQPSLPSIAEQRLKPAAPIRSSDDGRLPAREPASLELSEDDSRTDASRTMAMRFNRRSSTSSLASPWNLLSIAASGSAASQDALTPRSFASALAFENPGMRSRSLFSDDGSELSPGKSGEQLSVAPRTILTPPGDVEPTGNVKPPPPVNQRELLRKLLQI